MVLIWDASFTDSDVFTVRFAPYGKWNYACFRGGVTSMGSDSLGRAGNHMAEIVTNEANSCFGTEGGPTMRVELEQFGINETEGTDRYYGFSFYLPSAFVVDSGEWKNIAQWAVNKRIDYGVNPPLALTIEGNSLNLYICGCSTTMSGGCSYYPDNTGDRRKYTLVSSLQRNTWYDVVVHVKWSRINGFVYAWYQTPSKDYGNPTISESGKPTYYADSGTNFYGLGNYRGGGNTSTDIYYVMSYKIGTAFDDVKYSGVVPPECPVLICQIIHQEKNI